MKNTYLLLFFVLVSYQCLAQPRFLYDQAGNRIQRLTLPDLSPTINLPAAVFYGSGASAGFTVNIYEVGGAPTSAGTVTFTLTVPTGYSLAFNNTLTSITVSGSGSAAVTNTKWTVISSLGNQQLTLRMNAGEFIAASAGINIGFTITRTTANPGSVSNITVNVNNDPSQTYDSNPNNNIYARIIYAG